MVVRLYHLSARAPVLADVGAVTELMRACDRYETGNRDATLDEEVVRAEWQAAGFHLCTDAWVITNRVEQVVGYAEIRYSEEGVFNTRLLVHPEYRGRGIGTLLIRLVEARAHQMLSDVQSDVAVCLRANICDGNRTACQLYEREGYTVVRQYWRVLIDMNAASEQKQSGDALKFDLKIDAKRLSDTAHLPERVGRYSAHLYNTYEKVLRAGRVEHMMEALASR